MAFAAVALGLALLRRLSPAWLDGPAFGPLTWGELALLVLYPALCVMIATLELRRRGDSLPHSIDGEEGPGGGPDDHDGRRLRQW